VIAGEERAEAERGERARGRRRSRVRRMRRRIGSWLTPRVAPAVLERLSRTWRTERLDERNYADALGHEGRLLVFWHGRMLVPLPAHRDLGMCVLVSPSADGELVDPLLRRFGYATIRGSTNKRPVRALREMLVELERGRTVVVTPDGPRGPRHAMNQGPAWMAKATGYPVLPCGFVCDRAWHLASWDRFTIPKPRARVALVYGEPLAVAREAGEAELAAATAELAARMMAAEARGFRHLGVEPDW
jgi:hypothetical protein